jgi:hypothetical protein
VRPEEEDDIIMVVVKDYEWKIQQRRLANREELWRDFGERREVSRNSPFMYLSTHPHPDPMPSAGSHILRGTAV